jgi:hypothetical protein
MAHMLPPYVDKSCKSAAEKNIFRLLSSSAFSANWTVLHSLNLARHSRRLYGEIDFLLLIPGSGIYVMEVKGGDVRCTDGVWYFTDRFGNVNSSKSPFVQAREAMFSLLSAIEKEFGRGYHLTHKLMSFFCCFPDISFSEHSVEYEQWQVLDRDTLRTNPDAFFERLKKQTLLKHRNQRWFSESESILSSKDIDELCHFLRGDFERIRTSKERLEAFHQQVKSYTSEQFRILDHIHSNNRCLIQGSAGTGKTMVAMESAVRAAATGERVFLTCFNHMIGAWMAELLAPWKENISVVNLHAYLFEASRGFDYDQQQTTNQEFYTEFLPNLLTRMFAKGILPQFDRLIIDEGQDLIRPAYLQLFDAMLKGGLEGGRWEIYGDFEQQAIFAQLSRTEMTNLLNSYVSLANFNLRINCRNTKQIGMETALMSGFERPPFLLEHLEGAPVNYLWPATGKEVDILTSCLDRLVSEQVPLEEIIIISPRRLTRSVTADITRHNIREIRTAGELSSNQDFFAFATIQSFKGMEAGYIILTDIDDISSDQMRKLLYVGMSRARFVLIILLAETVKEKYKALLRNQLPIK